MDPLIRAVCVCVTTYVHNLAKNLAFEKIGGYIKKFIREFNKKKSVSKSCLIYMYKCVIEKNKKKSINFIHSSKDI